MTHTQYLLSLLLSFHLLLSQPPLLKVRLQAHQQVQQQLFHNVLLYRANIYPPINISIDYNISDYNNPKMYDNYYEIDGQRMCIDKDILIKGNKKYSPQTCLVVPNNINVLFTKSDKTRGKCLLGVDFRKGSGKYRARCSVETDNGYKNITLGFYETELEAFNVYKNFKENHIKEIADKYKNQIPIQLYNALYNYKVEITD